MVKEFLALLAAFGIIVTASNHLAKIFQRIKLPLITGFIIIGILVGPYLLKMIPGDLNKLEFVNDIALGFIAIAAGLEIYLKEIKDKIKSIGIMTATQFVVIFIVSMVLLMLFSDIIPFLSNVDKNIQIAISLLIATVFTSRSPASAIAVISELRAKGPLTKMSLGVIILKEFFVIILFAATFTVADTLVSGKEFHFYELLIVLLDIGLSIGIGYVYYWIIKLLFKINKSEYIDIVIILLLGWSMFLLSRLLIDLTSGFAVTIHLEPLLIGIVASFFITNYSGYRLYLQRLVEHFGGYVYAAFFTLIGATLSLDLLLKYWAIAFLLFGIRTVAVFLAATTGSIILRQSRKEILLSWMPYITQAGVSLGLITIVAAHFTDFGAEFEAILIAVIILNQFVGPLLMKTAIIKAGEAHTKAGYTKDATKDVFIFGLGAKAVLLAKTLHKEGYKVRIITDRKGVDTSSCTQIEIFNVEKIDKEALEKAGFATADAAVIMRKEQAAYEICELIYENYGVPNVIVVLEKHGDKSKFKELGAIVVAPTGALITLLADFVRSPQATSILMGMQQDREPVDIEVLDRAVHGKALRDLQLPLGVLILSVTRNGEVIMPHGYTRLRLHDIVTVVGSPDEVEKVRTKLQL